MDLNDKQLAYALTVLRADQHFTRVKQGIQQQLDKELKEMPAILSVEQLRQSQGRCQALQTLLTDFEDAADVYARIMER